MHGHIECGSVKRCLYLTDGYKMDMLCISIKYMHLNQPFLCSFILIISKRQNR